MRFRNLIVSVVAGSLLSGIATVGGAAPARAADPLFINWASLLSSLTNTYEPSSANDCVSGKPNCLDATIKEMQRRFNPLATACDHNAVFALASARPRPTGGPAIRTGSSSTRPS